MPRRRNRLTLIPTLVAAGLAAAPVSAQQVVLSDHFDDGTLDPAWQVSFENADAWSSQEFGTELSVTGISHVATDMWARVRLTRPVTPLADFFMRANISWDSGFDEGEAMQQLLVQLLAADGALVAQAYYNDGWVQWAGSEGGSIQDGSSWDTGLGTAPFSGSRTLEIEREGSDVTVRVVGFGGGSITGTSSTPVTQVRLVFSFYPHVFGGDVVSFFGGESIDLIQITVPSECPADLAEPFGTLDFSDVIAFLTAFAAMDPAADLADPIGTFDFSDVIAFLTAFAAGCP